jgi:hypothetical protein
MESKLFLYRERARDLEEKARLALDPAARAAYAEVAASYRHLAVHAAKDSFDPLKAESEPK